MWLFLSLSLSAAADPAIVPSVEAAAPSVPTVDELLALPDHAARMARVAQAQQEERDVLAIETLGP